MEFLWNEEQTKFRQEVRDFLTKQLPSDWFTGGAPEAETEEWFELTKKFLKAVGDTGWISMSWPKEYGGQECSNWLDAILGEEFSYFRAPAQDYWFRWKMISALLLHFGTDEQKKRHLPGIASGTVFWAQGFSEPGAGSDLGACQVKCVDKGDHWLINGQKIWTTGAHRAQWCFAPLMTDPDAPKRSRMLSMILIDLSTPGITINPMEGLDGTAELNEVFFDDVKVPKENICGERGGGWLAAMTLVNIERSGTGCVSLPYRVMEQLIEYCKETKHNGVLLSENPVIRQKIAQMAIEIEVCRSLAYRTAWIQATGQDVTTIGAIVKLYGSEMMQRQANTGLEIMGMHGNLTAGSKHCTLGGLIIRDYMWDLCLTIAGGTSEVQRIIISTMGLGLPRY